jgi:hypothetical protein
MGPAGLLAVLWLATAPRPVPWIGTWTFDVCHEDRRADHDKDTFCREGKDRIRIEWTSGGTWEITLCPADPWGERDVRLGAGGRTLSLRSHDGLDFRLTMSQDAGHFRGRFTGRGGHHGRVWGRRVAGC